MLKVEIPRGSLQSTPKLAPALASLWRRVRGLLLLRSHSPRKAHVLELALIAGAYLVYLGSRGLGFSDPDAQGLENAERVVAVEKWLGVFWEPAWQAWVLDHVDWLGLFFNWVYILTYWPIIALVGLTLYISNRPRYYYYRSVVVINLVIALLVFILFPVTSPFDLTGYFQNTIQTLGPSFYGSSGMASYYNTNAAMPSLHFSWTIILGLIFVRMAKGWLKPLGLLYPATTFFAITITGNHFILDAVAGGLLAAAAFAVMELGFRRRLFVREGKLEALKGLLRGGVALPPINLPKNWVRPSALVRRYTWPRHKTAV